MDKIVKLENFDNKKINDLRKKILDLRFKVEAGYFILSELLYTVYYNKLYKSFGYFSFNDYAEKELHFKYSKGLCLVKIWEDYIEKLKLNPKEIENIGWSKLSLMRRAINKDNYQEWINRAKKTSFDLLSKQVNTALHGQTIQDKEQVRLILSFTKEQYAVVDKAIEHILKELSIDSKSRAIEFMALNFLSGISMSKTKSLLPFLLSRLEDAVDKKIVVIDKTGNIKNTINNTTKEGIKNEEQ